MLRGEATREEVCGRLWRPPAVLPQAIVVAVAFSLSVLVLRYAWVSEDSFITFRYVANLHDGLGAVFNPGERVLGYTHPLWFGLLALGHWLVSDLVYLSVGLGVLLTALTGLAVGNSLFRHAGWSPSGALLSALIALLCASSDSWLSFQTGGLENPLSHWLLALLVIEVFGHGLGRPFRVSLLASLLLLSRPDFAPLLLPVSLLLLPRMTDARAAREVSLGTLPLVGWLMLCLIYYGSVVPTTAAAKLGNFPGWRQSVAQGFVYLIDWITHEPLPAVSALCLLVFATWRGPTPARRVLAAGIWLQLAWVVWVGGDFMRGRFLLSAFFASLVLGLLHVAEILRQRSLATRWSGALLLAGLVAYALSPSATAVAGSDVPKSGIVDERLFYPGYHLDSYARRGGLENPYVELALAAQLREYAEACGPVTVHARNPGTLGFLAGPRVSVIDILGLTDAYIAALPRKSLIETPPRVGHPDKYIPLRYLASRRDIAILEGWTEAVVRKDCAFARHTKTYRDSDDSWAPWKLFSVEGGS